MPIRTKLHFRFENGAKVTVDNSQLPPGGTALTGVCVVVRPMVQVPLHLLYEVRDFTGATREDVPQSALTLVGTEEKTNEG